MKLGILFFSLIAIQIPNAAYADDAPKTEVAKTDSARSPAFRCERIKGGSLPTLKQKLVDECNLNKPFSISEGSSIGAGSMTYCCHEKE